MRWQALIFLTLLTPALAIAQTDSKPADAKQPDAKQTDPKRAKIQVATDNAASGLMAEIGRQPLTRDLAVRDFLTATRSSDVMMDTLRQADQIGGPRWIDEATCQIRLEIGGKKVAAVLEKVSADAGDHSPVKQRALISSLQDWDRRTFAAVGTSIVPLPVAAPATQPVVLDLPAQPPVWVNQFMQAQGSNGTELTKLRAARAAETRALADLRTQIDQLPLKDKSTVGDAAKASPDLDQAIGRAVQKAKLTKLEYQSDGGATVQVTLNLGDVWREIDSFRQDAQKDLPR